MNIFEIHRRTESRIEPFHTRYLACCLKESKELLAKFWALATMGNSDWPVPSETVKVLEEDILDDGKRVDLVMIDPSSSCLIAVEAKTIDSSVEQHQLNNYLVKLCKKYPGYRIWITYLTPFNSRNKPKGSLGQEAIKEFTRFNEEYQQSSHISWKEVANLVWKGGDDVWHQHSEYIMVTICAPPSVKVGWGKLDDDLGWEIMRDFWQVIGETGFEAHNGLIKLRLDNEPAALVSTIKLLLSSEKLRCKAKCPRTVEEGVKTSLANSAYGQFHQQIFQLLNEYPFLGIRGKQGYGLTIPVHGVHRIVSICTVHVGHPERLTIGRTPRT